MPPSLKSLQSKIATHSTFMNTTPLAGAFHPEIQLLRTEIQEQPGPACISTMLPPNHMRFLPNIIYSTNSFHVHSHLCRLDLRFRNQPIHPLS